MEIRNNWLSPQTSTADLDTSRKKHMAITFFIPYPSIHEILLESSLFTKDI